MACFFEKVSIMSNGCVTLAFSGKATDFTRLILDESNIDQFVAGLGIYPKNSQLWVKAHEYFSKVGLEDGYNVIARGFSQTPDNLDIAERLAEDSVQMGIALKEVGFVAESEVYFADAERIYFDLTYAFEWQKVTAPLAELYSAWGRDENAAHCADAFCEPPNVEAINFLVEQRSRLDINVTKDAIHRRIAGLKDVIDLVPQPKS